MKMQQYTFFVKRKGGKGWQEFCCLECASDSKAWDFIRWEAHYSTTQAVYISLNGMPEPDELGLPPYSEQEVNMIRELARQNREDAYAYIAYLNSARLTERRML